MPTNDRFYIGFESADDPFRSVIKQFFDDHSVNYTDLGNFTDGEQLKYPAIAREVCEKVFENKCLGLLVSDTGIGMCMMANSRKGIRAALCTNKTMAELSRKKNNANVLCLGHDLVNVDEVIGILETFVTTQFQGDTYCKECIEYIDSQGADYLNGDSAR